MLHYLQLQNHCFLDADVTDLHCHGCQSQVTNIKNIYCLFFWRKFFLLFNDFFLQFDFFLPFNSVELLIQRDGQVGLDFIVCNLYFFSDSLKRCYRNQAQTGLVISRDIPDNSDRNSNQIGFFHRDCLSYRLHSCHIWSTIEIINLHLNADLHFIIFFCSCTIFVLFSCVPQYSLQAL